MSWFRRLTSVLKQRWTVVVVFAGFVHFMFFSGILYNYNLLHIQFKLSFNSSATEAGIPGAVSISLFRCSAVVVTYIFQVLGHRTTVMLGVSLCSLGLLVSSFVHDIFILYFTYGILFGFGYSATHLTIVDVILRNCDKRNASRTTCFSFCGVSLGFLISPCFDWLYETYSWRIALRILSVVLAFIGFTTGLVMTESKADEQTPSIELNIVKDNEKGEAQKGKNKAGGNDTEKMKTMQKYIYMFKQPHYVVSLIGFVFASAAISFTFISVGSYLSDEGMDTPSIAITIVWMGVSDLGARISAALFSDRLPISRATQFALNALFAVVPSLTMPFINSYVGFTISLIVISIPRSFMVILLPTIGMELSTNETRAEAVAVIYLVFGIGALLTPLVTDTMYDVLGSYNLAWFNCTGFYLMSAVFTAIAVLLKRRRIQSTIRDYSEKI